MPLDVVQGSTPPLSPSPGDQWLNTANGRYYTWLIGPSGDGAWVVPSPGDQWLNHHNGRYYTWLIGLTGKGAWVTSSVRAVAGRAPAPVSVDAPMPMLAPPMTNPTPKITSADTPPSTPAVNDLWFDTGTGFLFIWYYDGNTYQWVVTNPGRGSDVPPPATVVPSHIESDPGIILTPDPLLGIGSIGVDTTWLDARIASELPTDLPPSGVAGGDLAGSYPDPVVKASVALGGNPTATTQATSDSSQRLATTAFVKTNIAAIPAPPTTLPPSGAAGGDLTGNYPNPTLVGGPLSLYELLSHKGAASGYAPLDATTKVPAAYLPAYVDDVLEFANLGAFPATGSTGVIYVALDTNKVYRWSGSVYVEISPSPGSTDAVPEGAINKYYTDERVDDRVAVLIVPGTNITSTYNDVANTLTIAAASYPTALPPSGTAGGDLSGTYPNPLLKPSVTNGQIMTTVGGVSTWAAAPASATLPAGSVGYGAVGNTLTGVLANMSFDATNKRLGVGNASPAASVDITSTVANQGIFNATGVANSSATQNWFHIAVADPTGGSGSSFRIDGGTTGGLGLFDIDRGGDCNISGWLRVLQQTATPAGGAYYHGLYIGNSVSGNVGLFAGTGTPTLDTFGAFGSLYMNKSSPGVPWYNNNGSTGWDRLVGETSTQTLSNKTFAPASISPGTNGQVLTTVSGAAAWAAASGGSASVTVSDTPPGSPTSGALWWNSTLGVMFIWYVDPNTSQWVPVVPSGGSTPPNSIPQNAQTGNYTLVAQDAGQHIYHAVAAAAATYTIPANASVPFVIGTTVTFVNDSANNITLAITTDTLIWSPGTTAGSRTLGTGGIATALKVTATRWLLNGTALT